jgi:predicted nucleic-acid-binding protein
MTISGRVNHAFFVQLNFVSKTVYVWQGFRNIVVSGRTWQPVGPQATIDQAQDAIGDVVPAITLKVSGVDSSLLALALSESNEVQGRLAQIYDQYFDNDWQPFGDFSVFNVVRMDTLKITKRRNQDGTYDQVIAINSEQFLTNGPNPPYGRYSSTDQWARQGNTNDLYFEYMAINQNRRQRWPTY